MFMTVLTAASDIPSLVNFRPKEALPGDVYKTPDSDFRAPRLVQIAAIRSIRLPKGAWKQPTS